MSSRKGTVVTGCTGYMCNPPFFGDYVTRTCTEFRKNTKFTKIRSRGVV